MIIDFIEPGHKHGPKHGSPKHANKPQAKRPRGPNAKKSPKNAQKPREEPGILENKHTNN